MKFFKKKTAFISLILIFALLNAAFTSCSSPDESAIETTTEVTTSAPEEIPIIQEEDIGLTELLTLKKELRFKEDGNFRILVLSDVQSSAVPLQENVQNNIKTLVDRENPDLVLFCGDNSLNMTSAESLRIYLQGMVGYIEEKNIPWAHVYGNHDDETLSYQTSPTLSKEEQQKVYESFEWCVSKAGDEELSGVGNFVLPILRSDSDKIGFNVWCLDSGSYLSGKENSDMFPYASSYAGYGSTAYDYIRPDQIAWYYTTSQKLEEYNQETIPSIMSFHIPLQEFYTAWINRKSLSYNGEFSDSGIGASAVNSGMFSAVLARGDVKAIVCGHDHRNDFMIEYCGIKLCASSTPSNASYCYEDMLGARVLVINENDTENITTYMSYINKDTLDYNELDTISSDTLIDFENDDFATRISGYNGNTDGYVKLHEISLLFSEEKGTSESDAFAITRSKYNEDEAANDIEISFLLNGDSIGKLGEKKYLTVYVDLSNNGEAIDFGRACLGLITTDGASAIYRTSENTSSADSPLPFYYLADGATEWSVAYHSENGFFGANEGASAEGFKGLLAFPIEDMLQKGTGDTLKDSDVITGFYLYCTLLDEDMAENYFYIDDFSLVEDIFTA
ncbi:MAG: metallophosphoesterase family protein [Clostridia bacterium]|nr:metallophosphoesterase family protein [Clostridia bacterium]